MTTGERIKNARKAAGLTQRELGQRLGLSYQAVAQWENNLRKPKRETIYKMATALNVSPADLDESLALNIAMDFFEKIITESTHKGDETPENVNRRIFLGSDVIVKTENGERITVSMDTREGKMLSRFQALNELGKDEVIRYTDILLETNKYRKKPIEELPQEE